MNHLSSQSILMRRFQSSKAVLSAYFNHFILTEKELARLKSGIDLEEETALLKFISLIFDKEDKLNAIGFRNILQYTLKLDFQSDKLSRRLRTDPNLLITCLFKRIGCFKVAD